MIIEIIIYVNKNIHELIIMLVTVRNINFN